MVSIAIGLIYCVILVGACMIWQLLRQNGRILLRLDELEKRLNDLEFGGVDEPQGLPLGTEAPAFDLPDLAGRRHTLAQYRGQPVLLIFFNPDCGYCRDLAPKLAALPPGSSRREEAHSDRPDGRNPKLEVDQSLVTSAATYSAEYPLMLILTTGDAENNRQLVAEHKIGCPVLLKNDGEVAKAYQAHATPTGYLITAEGKIASEPAIGADALLALATEPCSSRREEAHSEKSEIRSRKSEIDQSLVTSAATEGERRAHRFKERSLERSKMKRDGLKAGTPAPNFHLPRLDGSGDLALEDFRGRRLLLVFSSPHCGPCNALAAELEKFYREHAEIGLVMISKGEPKENRAKVKEHGLTFPIVLQQHWEISRRYAMFATPIAYLIDEAGIIVKDVAVGVEPIRALLAESSQSVHREAVPVA